jgi:hypothetical protein
MPHIGNQSFGSSQARAKTVQNQRNGAATNARVDAWLNGTNESGEHDRGEQHGHETSFLKD